MKRPALIGLLAAAVALPAAGYAAFERYKIYLPGVIGNLRNPVQPYRPVTWEPGPAEPAVPPAARPPNIVLIVADDLGINDLTATGEGVGRGAVETPRIDSIAREGVLFANGYAANATCSPSRAALMTGRYPARFGFEFTSAPKRFATTLAELQEGPHPAYIHRANLDRMPPSETLGVPAAETTMAEVLKARGYRTLHIGKWHLGERGALRPEGQGFDETVGVTQGGALFAPKNDPAYVEARQDFDPVDRFLWANLRFAVEEDGGKPFRPDRYVTDFYGDEAVKAIEANRNRPFFLYLGFTAPHTPLQATKADYDALPQIGLHRERVYGAMIRSLDRNVGKVLDTLKRLDLDENTLVIFTSDNGGAHYIGIEGVNRPYRGWKATFFEGGIRVPFMMKWPAQVPAGQVATERAMHIDVFRTAAAAAGADVQRLPLDGADLIALSRGQAADRPLFFRSGHYKAVIQGDWKLQVSERPKKTWLFNLAADPYERTNLSLAQPAKVAELRRQLAQEDARAGAPLWPVLLEGPIPIDQPLGRPWPKAAEYVMWAN